MQRNDSPPASTRRKAAVCLVLTLALLPADRQVLAQPAGGYCPAVFTAPAPPVVAGDAGPDATRVSAEYIDYVEDGVSRLEGDVALNRQGWQARADEVFYDAVNDRAELRGAARLWGDNVYVSGARARLDFDADASSVEDSEYYLPAYRGRGAAARLFVAHGGETRGEDINYTTCAPTGFEGGFWTLSASRLDVDHDAERATGRNVVLRIKGAPVFYSPWLTFPLSKKRKSGLLSPSVGTSKHGGFEGRIPYYWNIAANVDATITARTLADSGVMGAFEYRYLFGGGGGQFNLEYLPDDSNAADRDRSMINIELNQSFLGRGQLYVNYNRASDPEYLEDFGTDLAISSTRFLPRRADLTYRGRNWSVLGRLHSYQIVDQSIAVTSRPYKNLPRLQLRYRPLSGNNRLNLDLRTDFTYFDRTGEAGVTVDVTGFRADLYPSVSYPIRTQAAFLVPKVGVRFTQYELDMQGPFKKSPNRTLPIVSVDSGVFLERDFRMRDGDFLHTLEPRLFYLYVPYEDQNDLPVFDSSVFNLDYNALFRENRFSGYDRIGDTNQATLALGSRLISRKTGRQVASLQVAQSFYLEDQNVIRQILGAGGELRDIGTVENDTLSPLVVEADANLLDDLRLGAELYWDPKDNLTRKMALTAQYNPPGNKVVNLAYRVRRAETGQIRRIPTDIEQSDVSFRWPVTHSLNAVGRWNYAFSEGRTLDLFFGAEYEGCCFAVKAVYRRFLANLDGDFNTGFFLQLQLKGLGSIGERTVDLLNQAIPGYRDSLPPQ